MDGFTRNRNEGFGEKRVLSKTDWSFQENVEGEVQIMFFGDGLIPKSYKTIK
ncbi:MAG: hypothetical protein IID18_04270 [Nitrospinae bacterium]|nr:hypothetical protein [Nitrospinota bacterium]